jgi:hypothetical protein
MTTLQEQVNCMLPTLNIMYSNDYLFMENKDKNAKYGKCVRVVV